MSASGEHRIEAALDALSCALGEMAVPWMIIGGIAVIARGVRRMTTDIDAVVRGDSTTIRELSEALARHEIEPRIRDAAAFARRNLVLLVRHEPTGVDLDVSFAWSTFEHEAIEACSEVLYGKVKAPMAAPDDLMIYKAVAARPRDLADLEALLLIHPSVDLSRVRRRVAELAALAEAPELSDSLEAAIAKTRAAATRARRRGPPMRRRSRKKNDD
jgi:hypothetical protein